VPTVLLSGSSGFIGAALTRSLVADGFTVVPLRRSPGAGVPWDAERGTIDTDALSRAAPGIVINLAGEPIAHRWTRERRKKIYESRVRGTRALSRALVGLPQPPRVMISGSAIGYYGSDRGDAVLTEGSEPGTDFLAGLARDWESATSEAEAEGVRVATLRTGIVCGEGGGALARMLPPFRAGVGGPLGGGRQWMSWISVTDAVRAIRFLADNPEARGPFNIVAPAPVRNEEFSRVLGRVLGRPSLIPVPRLALLALYGEMADQTVLASQRVVPEKLTGAGFEFRHPLLEQALRAELRQ
jgi:uncharacterized protein